VVGKIENSFHGKVVVQGHTGALVERVVNIAGSEQNIGNGRPGVLLPAVFFGYCIHTVLFFLRYRYRATLWPNATRLDDVTGGMRVRREENVKERTKYDMANVLALPAFNPRM
jgi:hypothetical protein